MRGEVVSPLDVNQVVVNLIQHHEAALEMSFLQRRPDEGLDHVRDTAGSLIVAHYKTSSTSLDLLHLMKVALGVGIPCR